MVLIADKKDALLESLRDFYSEPSHLETLMAMLGKKSPVSLRLLDYLVTNYAKKKNIVYPVTSHKSFNIFVEYKSQLKAYSKRWFDPFCRRERVNFEDVIVSTVGQLNFMRWAMTHGVIEYAMQNVEDIESDMNQTTGARAHKRTGEKRKELCKAAVKSCTKTDITVTVRF
jgi:hypothetical protein